MPTGGAFVAALHTSNGNEAWSTAIPDRPDPYGMTTPDQQINDLALYQGNLYATTLADLVAIDAQSGKIRWDTSVGLISTKTFVGPTLYVSTGDAITSQLTTGDPTHVYTFDLGTGKSQDLKFPDGEVDFTHAFFQNRAYVVGGPTQGDLFAVDLSTGTTAWQVPGTGKISFVEAVGANVYVVQDNGRMMLLSAKDGKSIWSHSGEQGQGKDIVFDGNELYLPGNGKLEAIDIQTGKNLWTQKISGHQELNPFPPVPTVFLTNN